MNLSKLVKTDHKGTDLCKTHNYQTRFKAEPNLPRTKSSNYQNSFLHQNIKVFSTLPAKVKHKTSLKSFTHAIKRTRIRHSKLYNSIQRHSLGCLSLLSYNNTNY